jgi:hypothetical protein
MALVKREDGINIPSGGILQNLRGTGKSQADDAQKKGA